MDDLALDHIRAFIARTRVAEMKSRGWRVVGPGEEGSVLMEGPMPGAGGKFAGCRFEDGPVGDLFEDLVARALERADARDRTDGRRAA
ncbi:hypothetical protein [Azospirillum picis]|uniref:Uncharacterized protein n=1 Tax=Azospirillum picis TaxID=488438 RepID=A0ABU0MFR3_9PROT|nr:hypothetical protein [Azospirillum picis]MBP2298689.1 hypothetical protein [Azospirillum picis]MDQ0532262.1 hypothetical protein [Azospirillum picis]